MLEALGCGCAHDLADRAEEPVSEIARTTGCSVRGVPTWLPSPVTMGFSHHGQSQWSGLQPLSHERPGKRPGRRNRGLRASLGIVASRIGPHRIPPIAPTGTMNALCPVYAVQSPDNRRFFVLNRRSDTITVINSQDNTLDNQCPTGCVNQDNQTYYTHPILPLSTTAVTATGVTPPIAQMPTQPAVSQACPPLPAPSMPSTTRRQAS